MCQVKALTNSCGSSCENKPSVRMCRTCGKYYCKSVSQCCKCGEKVETLPSGCQGLVNHADTNEITTVCGNPIKYHCQGSTSEMFLCEVCVTAHTKDYPSKPIVAEPVKAEPYQIPSTCEQCRINEPSHFDAKRYLCAKCVAGMPDGNLSIPTAASYPIIQTNADVQPIITQVHLLDAYKCQGITEVSEQRFELCGERAIARCQRCGNNLCKVCKTGHGGDMCNPPAKPTVGLEIRFIVKRVVWSPSAQWNLGRYGYPSLYTIDNPNIIVVTRLRDLTGQNIIDLPNKAIIFVKEAGVGELHMFSCLAADQKKDYVVVYPNESSLVLPTKASKIDFKDNEVILYTTQEHIPVAESVEYDVDPVAEDADTQLDIVIPDSFEAELAKDDELDKQVEQVFSNEKEQKWREVFEESKFQRSMEQYEQIQRAFARKPSRVVDGVTILVMVLLLLGLVAISPYLLDQPVSDAVTTTAYKVYSAIVNYPEVP